MIFQTIETLCKERGISIARLERETNLGNATVRGWETGIPRVDKLKVVADYFGVTIDYLVNGGVTKKTYIPKRTTRHKNKRAASGN